jgi:hypothetical protein
MPSSDRQEIQAKLYCWLGSSVRLRKTLHPPNIEPGNLKSAIRRSINIAQRLRVYFADRINEHDLARKYLLHVKKLSELGHRPAIAFLDINHSAQGFLTGR